MKRIAISLLTCNNPELVQYTLNSLITSDIIRHSLHLFLWVNESDDRTKWEQITAKYKEFMNITLSLVPDNIGIVKPRIILFNQIKRLNFDYLLEIHDDMLFPDFWFTPLIDSFKIKSEVLGFNPVLVMPFIYADFEMNLDQESINMLCAKYRNNNFYTNTMPNHPWLISMGALKQYGYYDPEFSPQICEDDDLYFRFILAGEYTVTNRQSVVMHKKGYTRFDKLPMDYKNFRLIKQKHGDFLDNLRNQYLYYDDQNKDFFKGEFAWITEIGFNNPKLKNINIGMLTGPNE